MNVAITEGLQLDPPPFSAGLGVWSSGDGRPGSDTYAGSGGGVFVPADQDFGGAMEIVKTASTQRVRWMGQTPIRPGLYLRVTARVKAIAGALPAVRIAGTPVGSGGGVLGGVATAGPATQIAAYGEVVTVTGIVGTGVRGGTDMVWPGAAHGHLGLDLTGPTGGILRIDDIEIEDITSAYLRDMLAVVDVRDYGALGNGTANDAPAFNAADAAANGREVLVPGGTYYLNGDVTMQNPVRFEGTVSVPDNRRFILQRNFDFDSYLAAFGNEEQAFRKAFQALLNFADHESLDLCGRRIGLTRPLDMAACDPGRTTFHTRRVIRNGQFQPIDGPDWTASSVQSQASYVASSPLTLTGVANIANIERGSRVHGTGVGREVYVREVNIAQQRITLSAPLYDSEGTRTYTFVRYRYLLDFTGFDDLSQFVIDDVEFQCNGQASALALPRQGLIFHLRDCAINKPEHRGITSIGSGCQGLLVDRCNFQSNEQALPVDQRGTIALNTNANDVKIRDCRVVMFLHFAVIGGSGATITGNHWFHGDETVNGVRRGGLVFTSPNVKSTVIGNYIDNNFIEWTNEHDATPALGQQFSFGGLSITGNIFTVNDVADWFNFIVVKPYGPNHYIHGLSVTGNVFRSINGYIDRVDRVDTTFAGLDMTRMRNVTFADNVFHGVNEEIRNPVSIEHAQSTASRIWVVDTGTFLPFGGRARVVESVVATDRIRTAGNTTIYESPWTDGDHGPGGRQVRVIFDSDVLGSVRAMIRMDNPN
ncbi:glycosyl hydrolase family 28-related protein [Wenxinia saemankumensis]|uniref:Pectate lyase superfamily protein n=1 Tax=Wenxinia saemankumensis TaxID=1447782 RepID=A0A1M6ER11_9RHOB|nr:glycosyl hydrolase family 28-related protein [Wenxinia saemankumensis]SHI87878.1 Pectate lyase superfamily protein [Wenxinia saemankumensis]